MRMAAMRGTPSRIDGCAVISYTCRCDSHFIMAIDFAMSSGLPDMNLADYYSGHAMRAPVTTILPGVFSRL
jgi:hypothetical protein